ncbi:unnamed protein product [Adineta steineri]|uniref:Uncharacterized protein n=1 Tax=Adineta steineri TaxID=433720 RepID=A0A819J0H0_9BILA|nr:unnamed protein product [Adineta steineri]CAF3888712.1 unnamed protein product [Adineta steineri]CAF3922744.1 unnamed protein product [Adineta steineri]
MSSSTSTINNNRPIEYTITCSDATGQQEKFVFHQHTAPVSICQQFNPSSLNQTKIQVVSLMSGLVKAHTKEVLQARTWYCVECNQPATTIIHNPMSYLHLSKPQVIDLASPCCASKICDKSIQAHFAEIMSEVGVPNGFP